MGHPRSPRPTSSVGGRRWLRDSGFWAVQEIAAAKGRRPPLPRSGGEVDDGEEPLDWGRLWGSHWTASTLSRSRRGFKVDVAALWIVLRQAVEFDHVLTQNTKTDLPGEVNADA